MPHHSGRPLPRAFYARPTLDVLADLIGLALVHDERGGRTAGLIVEAEAYIGEADAACHAAPGPTKRNAPLYGPPGFAYVYLNYGLHEMANVVTEAEGSPAAILIRALAPVEGVLRMRRRRAHLRRASGLTSARVETPDLCRGPGNLTVALGIDRRLNRADLTCGPLRIEDWGTGPVPLAWSRRVGIRVAVEHEWRCAWAGHPSVSGPRR